MAAAPAMDQRIAQFANLLRESGFRISLSEHMDALEAARAVGLADREAFKDALRATLAKRAIDLAAFDELFDLYFGGLGEAIRASAAEMQAALGLEDADLQDLMETLAALARELRVELSPLAQALLQNDAGTLERLLREAGARVEVQGIQRPMQEGRYSHAIAQALGLSELNREIEDLKQRLEAAGLDEALLGKIRAFVDRRLRDLTDIIKRYVRSELEKRDHAARDALRVQSLAEKSFYYLSEEEIRRMNEAVKKLAERLKNTVSVRRKRAKRGKFDIKDTLRKNLQYGGTPFRLQLDRRVRDKPQVVILCDVSDSVRNVSRFMLQFVYSLQDLYSRVRSFIFVSELGEITKLFEEHEITEAIEQALTGNIVNVFAHSDFGRAFRIFHRDYLGCVTRKTSVIILGDARNNYNHPHEWVLKEIRKRAKQLIWLNPENRLTWGFGDSEMDRYQPYCDLVEECRNLKQLYRVIDRLVM